MERMRDVLRSSLGASLSALTPEDRLAAAWPVVAGAGIGQRSSIAAFSNAVVTVQVPDAAWQRQMQSMGPQLRKDLARIAGVAVTDILFSIEGAPARTPFVPKNSSATKPRTTRRSKP